MCRAQSLDVDAAYGNSPYTVGATGSFTSITVGDTGTGILSDSAFTVTSTTTVILGNTSTGVGSFNLSGTGGLSDTVGKLYVGLNGTGIFNQSGSSTVALGAEQMYLGNSSTGVGTYYLGGTASYTGSTVYVGGLGTGTFNQTGGSMNLTTHSLVVAASAGSLGTFLMSGGTDTVNAFYVGNASTGVAVLSGGIVAAAGSIEIGYTGAAGSTGTLNISGGTVLTAGVNVYDGYQTPGVLNFTGGTFNVSGNTDVAYGSSGTTNTFNFSAGTLNGTGASSNLSIGYLGVGLAYFSGTSIANVSGGIYLGMQPTGNGLLNISGSSVVSTATNLTLGNAGSGVVNVLGGTLNVSGLSYVGLIAGTNGTLNISTGIVNATGAVFAGNGGTGTVIQTGGTYNVASSNVTVAFGAGSIGQYNLAGGTLIANSLTGGSGTSTVYFSGGTFLSTGSNATVSGLTDAYVLPGGVNFNTSSASVTVTANLLANPAGSGGPVTKIGSGTLTFNGANTYTGGTNISAGTVTVGSSTALGNGNVTNYSTLNIGGGAVVNLNLGSGAYTQAPAAVMTLQVNSNSAASSLQTTGAISLAGTLNLNVNAAATASTTGGKIQVLTGPVTGVFTQFTTSALPTGVAVDTSGVEKSGRLGLVSYFNGFENLTVNGISVSPTAAFSNSVVSYVLGNSAVTPGTATQVVSPANASSNDAYGKLVPTAMTTAAGSQFPATAYVGPLTRFNGNSTTFGGGFTTQSDIFINPAWTGDANGTGFDYSSADSNSSGNFQRDFILHVFSSGGTLYASASSNSDYKPDANYVQNANKIAITTAAWYTVQDTFRPDGTSGNVDVDIKLFNNSGGLLFQQTQVTPDPVSSTGGNNYAWFVNIDTGTSTNNFLNVDNVKLLNGTGSGLAQPFSVTTGSQILSSSPALNGNLNKFMIDGLTPGGVDDGYTYVDAPFGVTSLSGDLTVDIGPTFESEITASDTFTLLQSEGFSGSFDNVTDGGRVNTADGIGSFQVNFETGGNGEESVVLSNFQTSSSVPEPASLSMLSIGGITLLGRRRRARSGLTTS